MHHTLDCAKTRFNRGSHWLVNGSIWLTESFVKIICLVWKVCEHPYEPFLSGAPHAYFDAPLSAPCTSVQERWLTPLQLPSVYHICLS